MSLSDLLTTKNCMNNSVENDVPITSTNDPNALNEGCNIRELFRTSDGILAVSCWLLFVSRAIFLCSQLSASKLIRKILAISQPNANKNGTSDDARGFVRYSCVYALVETKPYITRMIDFTIWLVGP